MKGFRAVAAAAAAVAGVGAAVLAGVAPGLAAAAPAAVLVPPSLRVPAGNHLVITLHVIQGVQVYSCEKGAWVLLEPDANMGRSATGRPIVLYTAGPKWISTVDGSAVTGMPLASVNEKGTIPDLLVKAIANRGSGLFGHIDFIQRLATSGGLAPRGMCADGTITASAYHATERFWAKNKK